MSAPNTKISKYFTVMNYKLGSSGPSFPTRVKVELGSDKKGKVAKSEKV